MRDLLPRTKNKEKLLKDKCKQDGFCKLENLNNPKVTDFIARYLEHCNPDSAFVRTDSQKDVEYIRKRSIEKGEERQLEMDGHTVHFDGYNDQARDKENTKFLLPPDKEIGRQFNSINKEKGLKEIRKYLENIMKGKEAYICFFCLGPKNSKFSIPALQITDSTYVAHSEDILYRDGYDLFKNRKFENEVEFFKFVHSAGPLEGGVSKKIHKRRIYTDLEANTVFSTHTQYGGNTIGAKKLAMRLAIKKASEEGWLTEHMFIMGVHGDEDRTTYFTGAYPSACGKTSTSMIESEKLVGDDIAYLREINGELRAANPERGIFGIIRDVSPDDDPLIWKTITTPGEVIFSNVLIKDGKPYWMGMGKELPEKGINHSGKWWKGKKDESGKPIDPSHRNARYTVRISDLENKDPNLENPDGVKIKGIIYGGRDSDTWVPVSESFNWKHGILTKGSALESETTSATLGKSGTRRFNPMSNLDFLSIKIRKYIKNQIRFGERLNNPPSIFSVNYFLKDENDEYLNGIHDKKVWLKWMELRTHKEVAAVKTPTGYIPKYDDLEGLFENVLGKNYSRKDYTKQFSTRIPEHLAKIERIKTIYKERVKRAPEILFEELEKQKKRLEKAKEKYGNYVDPENFC
ncbi:phosphoenolpyruvate carboxykinase [candidate division MSBL1 archaeon SCGC-AAA259E19]|uniref:Phosphoenolpyruvate carboxykinase [GTP] n=2 Tax=candidate division MSBL1 TaxID=215777 RepID=A0A133UNP1_9EURY|nr:phosphoenolpyruvate carboxykinase [candidate division MSBL1 archaeon SCGC-AAA259E19]